MNLLQFFLILQCLCSSKQSDTSMHKSVGSRPSAILKSQSTRLGNRKSGVTAAGDSSLLSLSSSSSSSTPSPSSLTAISSSRQLTGTAQHPRRGRQLNNIPIRNMATKPQLNVHDFPRPPLVEQTPRHLVIKWNNQVVADTKEAYWVLETTHPPSKRLLSPSFYFTCSTILLLICVLTSHSILPTTLIHLLLLHHDSSPQQDFNV